VSQRSPIDCLFRLTEIRMEIDILQMRTLKTFARWRHSIKHTFDVEGYVLERGVVTKWLIQVRQ
jgi:hypothetical protein